MRESQKMMNLSIHGVVFFLHLCHTPKYTSIASLTWQAFARKDQWIPTVYI